jgi:hypothetical protein
MLPVAKAKLVPAASQYRLIASPSAHPGAEVVPMTKHAFGDSTRAIVGEPARDGCSFLNRPRGGAPTTPEPPHRPCSPESHEMLTSM